MKRLFWRNKKEIGWMNEKYFEDEKFKHYPAEILDLILKGENKSNEANISSVRNEIYNMHRNWSTKHELLIFLKKKLHVTFDYAKGNRKIRFTLLTKNKEKGAEIASYYEKIHWKKKTVWCPFSKHVLEDFEKWWDWWCKKWVIDTIKSYFSD